MYKSKYKNSCGALKLILQIKEYIEKEVIKYNSSFLKSKLTKGNKRGKKLIKTFNPNNLKEKENTTLKNKKT